LFRTKYLLVVTAQKSGATWSLLLSGSGSQLTTVDKGTLNNFDVSPNAGNDFVLTASGASGELDMNGSTVTQLDLSQQSAADAVSLFIFGPSSRSGQSINYENFTVSTPSSGGNGGSGNNGGAQVTPTQSVAVLHAPSNGSITFKAGSL